MSPPSSRYDRKSIAVGVKSSVLPARSINTSIILTNVTISSNNNSTENCSSDAIQRNIENRSIGRIRLNSERQQLDLSVHHLLQCDSTIQHIQFYLPQRLISRQIDLLGIRTRITVHQHLRISQYSEQISHTSFHGVANKSLLRGIVFSVIGSNLFLERNLAGIQCRPNSRLDCIRLPISCQHELTIIIREGAANSLLNQQYQLFRTWWVALLTFFPEISSISNFFLFNHRVRRFVVTCGNRNLGTCRRTDCWEKKNCR